MTERAGLASHHQPLLALVEVRQHRLELCPQRLHHAGVDSHYHITADEVSNRAVIYRQAFSDCIRRFTLEINGNADSSPVSGLCPAIAIDAFCAASSDRELRSVLVRR